MSRTQVSKALYLLIIFFCGLTTSNKLPSLDNLKQDKLNECERCKVLTDSFNHWMKKTSRGKYEGGDTAWEETKLKSYARSEIRLVEIQEGLCSELSRHQDYCYSLTEEADQVLEKWWFYEDPNSVDLHTWLCIESLKYCCPINHFGETCTPCPLDKDNNICSGHGKCDGDGTRNGNGTCICKRGYMGEQCEACTENFFSNIDGCEPCHQACIGCSAEGPAACNSCKLGWQLEKSGICVDINECLSTNNCKNNEFCVNREGSYKCRACDSSCKTCTGMGAKNCTSCEPLRYLWGGMCITMNDLEDILIDSVKRLSIYFGIVLVATIILTRTTYYTATSVMLTIIAVFAYYVEKRSNMNTLDLLKTVYQYYNHTQVYPRIISTIDRVYGYFE